MFWAMYYIPLAMVRMACDQAEVVGLEYMIDGTYEQVMDHVLAMKRNPDLYAEERDKFRQRILYYEKRQKKQWKQLIDTVRIGE